MIRNIIFDFGGVLVDWNPHYLYDDYFKDPARCEYFLKHVCNRAWYTVGDAGIPLREAIDMQARHFPDFKEPLEMFYDDFMLMIRGEIPGIRTLIEELKSKGYRVYGLTNWAKESFRMVEERMSIFGLLDGRVVSSEEFMIKPFPDIYRLILERFGLKAEESVFIDDTPINAVGADMVGIHGLVFSSTEQLRKDLEALLK